MKHYNREVFQMEQKMQLWGPSVQRKYVTEAERDRMLEAAGSAERLTRTFCMCLAYSGCRLSEATGLTVDRVDLEGGTIVFRTLKRRTDVYRTVPVPAPVIEALDLVHGIRELQQSAEDGAGKLLWSWSRTTAWRRVTGIMRTAGISGPQAYPKGLRHGFGILAVQSGVPLNMIGKWLGHSDISITAVYADAVGEEERNIAGRMWRRTPAGKKGAKDLPLLEEMDRS